MQVLSEKLGDGQAHLVVLKRLSEALQADATALTVLADIGMLPGQQVEAELMDRVLVLRSGERQVTLPAELADQIFVAR